MKKIAIVIGTRPEGIKLAPVVNCIKSNFNETFIPLVIATGQHKEILDDVFKFFKIKPDLTLEIDRKSSLLSALQGQLIQTLEALFCQEKPDIVMVQGDTLTTLSGAIAAFYQKIPIAYVESGLRSGQLYEPFPEEANRRMITQLTKWHFTPTKKATQTLKNEGVIENVFEVGNTIVDAIEYVKNIGFSDTTQHHDWVKTQGKNNKMVLITIHRRENWDQRLDNIIKAITKIANTFNNDVDFVWIAHPNPALFKRITDGCRGFENINIYPPANYIQLLHLMSLSHVILTDSGGIQEEAPSMNVPVLVARDVTERMEGIEEGCAKLIGTNPDNIIKHLTQLLTNSSEHQKMIGVPNPYGDGTSSQQILKILSE